MSAIITYGEWLDLWLAAKLSIRERTRNGYESHMRLYLKPALGHVELTKLRAEHLDALYAGMRAREDRPSPSTIARVHATVRASLNAALVRRHIAFNPALQVELERVHAAGCRSGRSRSSRRSWLCKPTTPGTPPCA